MKQSILFLTATFFFALSSSAQFDKKNWLVGGNGSFKSLNNNFQSNNADWEYKITDIKLTPNIGYFFIDKFAAGLKFTLDLRNEKGLSVGSAAYGKSLRLDYGPFVRYYFLDKENKSYQQEIIVSPNFGSYDYLYNKVDLIQSKIEVGPFLGLF